MSYLFQRAFVVILTLAAFTFAQSESERQATIFNDQGVSQFQKGLHQAAIKSFNQALAADPKRWAAHLNLGHAHRAMNDLASSEAAFRKAIELRPDHAITYNQLGIVLMEAQRDRDALEVFLAALARSADHPVILLNAANCRIALKDFRGAIEFLEKARTLDPQNAGIRVSLGYAYAMRDKIQAAINEVREAERINPTDEKVKFFLGTLYLANRDRDAALAQQKKIHATSPELARRLFQAINRDKIVIIPAEALGFR